MKLLLILCVAWRLCAQNSLDHSIPESPALSVLALTPAVVRPATPRELAVSILSGSQTGIAMDIAPYWLAAGHLVDRQIYKAKPIVRLLAGTQLSLASAKGEQPGDPSRLAAGILIRLFDRGDPRLDDVLAACLQHAAER